MKTTENIYKKLQETFPELFTDSKKRPHTSTLFAEFLPTIALSNPAASPWGEYSNREFPLIRKTVIISLKNLQDTVSVLIPIDEIARFLKRADFEVYVSLGPVLAVYDTQLFETEHLSKMGTASRTNIQNVAVKQNKVTSADDIFFIDDLTLKEDSRHCFIQKFKSFEKEIALNKTIALYESKKDDCSDPDSIYLFDSAQYYTQDSIPNSIGILILRNRNSLTESFKSKLYRQIGLADGENIFNFLLNAGLSDFDIGEYQTGLFFPVSFGPHLEDSQILNFPPTSSRRLFRVAIKSGMILIDFCTFRDSPYRPINHDDHLTLENNLFINTQRKITLRNISPSGVYNNLHSVSIGSTITKPVLDILRNSVQTIEALTIAKKEFIPKEFNLTDIFENLRSFKCHHFSGELNLTAPKLSILNLTINSQTDTVISITRLPLLSYLEINVLPASKSPHFKSINNKNLVEVSINGDIHSLTFIEDLLEKSPQLKKIKLNAPNISEKEITELQEKFQKIRWNIFDAFKSLYRVFLPTSDDLLHEKTHQEIPEQEIAPEEKTTSVERSNLSEKDIEDLKIFSKTDSTVHDAFDESRETDSIPSFLDNISKTQVPLTEENTSVSRSTKLPSLVNKEEVKTEDNIVYTGATRGTDLTSDFDTQHNPNLEVNVRAVAKHLSTEKKQRFRYIRIGVYHLDDEGLLQKTSPRTLVEHILPNNNDPLLTQGSQDYYEFSQTVSYQPGEMFQLQSLSPIDYLFKLSLNGQSLNGHVKILKNDLGFYFVKVLEPNFIGKLTYILDIPPNCTLDIPFEQQDMRLQMPEALQTTIKKIQHFPYYFIEALEIEPNATPQEKLEAMYQQEKASCRHRAAILLYKLQILKESVNKETYANIQARAVYYEVHTAIELSLDKGKTWAMCDLGGFQVIEKNQSIILPPINFSAKKTSEGLKTSFQQVLANLHQARGQNTLFCLRNALDIQKCVSFIRHFCYERPFFFVNSLEQLKTSVRRLKLDNEKKECEIVEPPAGRLHDFLMSNQTAEPPPIIMINWENFDISHIVQFNAVIDLEKRYVDHTPLPPGTTLIGLHSQNEKMADLLQDSSFVSRHVTGGIHDLTGERFPELSESEMSPMCIPRFIDEVLEINLHFSPRWHDILIGKAYVDGYKLGWEDGQLLALLEDPSITHVALINPPKEDSEFTHFLADLREGLPLTLLNQTFPLHRKINVNLIHNSSYRKTENVLFSRVNHLIADAYIISSGTFEQCLHNKVISEEGLMLVGKGLLEAHTNQALKLCICDSLSESQWSLMLEQATKYNVLLNCALLTDVTLPTTLSIKDIKTISIDAGKSPNRFIISDDVEYSVFQLQKQMSLPLKSVDFSEVNIDDLFCKINYSNTSKGFYFKKSYSDIWHALKTGETVILKGFCSDEMLNFLSTMMSPSPYFFIEGKRQTFSGKLIVVADKGLTPPAWLSAEIETISLAKKRQAFGIFEDIDAMNMPFIHLAQSKKLEQLPTLNLIIPDSENLSLKACEQFERNRLDAVKHAFKYSPIVVLEGPPGAGKSYFMRTFSTDPTIKLYREDEIEQWATDSDELIDSDNPIEGFKQKILVRDEINLRGGDCSQDRDLLNVPPSIFVKGKYFQVSKNCKIIYAQNPLEYGGERHEPQLFQDLPACKIIFTQMPKAFILHRILKPIFTSTFEPEEAITRATQVLNQHYTTSRSIRDLQTQAVFECALHRNPLPLAPIQNVTKNNLGQHRFFITPSRYPICTDLLTLLQARLFKRSLPKNTPGSVKHSGINGLVLRGPAGVGKSGFIEYLLQNEGYNEVDLNATEKQLDSSKIYYRIHASESNDQKLRVLQNAFQTGSILIIDEIDSCSLLEGYLNAYLVGEDIYGKPAEKPGFTILSTANGASMKGRKALPVPFLSRMLVVEFKEYSREELIQILSTNFIGAGNFKIESKGSISRLFFLKGMIEFIVDDFLTQQRTLESDASLTFRELYEVTKDYFHNKFELYTKLNLSISQHQFMLAYRNDLKIEMLKEKLSSGELDPKTITSLDMQNELTKEGTQAVEKIEKTERPHKPHKINTINENKGLFTFFKKNKFKEEGNTTSKDHLDNKAITNSSRQTSKATLRFIP